MPHFFLFNTTRRGYWRKTARIPFSKPVRVHKTGHNVRGRGRTAPSIKLKYLCMHFLSWLMTTEGLNKVNWEAQKAIGQLIVIF